MSDTATAAASVKHTRHHQSTLARLTDQPWWTQADQAELDALWGCFLDEFWEHRRSCTVCAGCDWCRPARSAFQVVLDFRESRIRVSKAQWLRLTNEAVQT